MAIAPKDLKLLWGKAAGRCAITKRRLSEKGSADVVSGDVVLGEACHIVAEQPDGPRGKSVLSAEDRNRYPNLILLCADKHTLIDKDPSAWPIEKLHQLKAEHELWVEEQLTVARTHEDEMYANFIEAIGEKMHLDNWEALSSYMMRCMVHETIVEGADALGIQLAKTIWPKKHPLLEANIENLVTHITQYTQWAMMHATYSGPFFTSDRFYRRFRDEDGSALAAARIFDLWERICRLRVVNVTHAINEYCAAVRATLNPSYFYCSGRFGVHDGDLLRGSSFLIPVVYNDVAPLVARYERWMELLKTKGGPFTVLEEEQQLGKGATPDAPEIGSHMLRS